MTSYNKLNTNKYMKACKILISMTLISVSSCHWRKEKGNIFTTDTKEDVFLKMCVAWRMSAVCIISDDIERI